MGKYRAQNKLVISHNSVSGQKHNNCCRQKKLAVPRPEGGRVRPTDKEWGHHHHWLLPMHQTYREPGECNVKHRAGASAAQLRDQPRKTEVTEVGEASRLAIVVAESVCLGVE
jgi:hypothetical protein